MRKGKRETSRWQMIGSFTVGVFVILASIVFAFMEVDPPEGFYWFASSFVAIFTANYAVRKTAFERTFRESFNQQAGGEPWNPQETQ